MFSILDFYDLIKIPGKEDSVTVYDFIIGNSGSYGDHYKGLWIVHQIDSQIIGSPTKIKSGQIYKQKNIIQLNFQFDFYISMDTIDEVFIETEKMRSYLFSKGFASDLKQLNSEILPVYSNINYFSESLETNEFVNRGNFTISIITASEIDVEVDIIKKINNERNFI